MKNFIAAGLLFVSSLNVQAENVTVSPIPPGPGYIAGLGLSNDGTTPNTIVDYATGVALDTTNITLMAAVSGTVNFGTTGAGGLDTGAIAASTWYGLFVISGASGNSAVASKATSWAILGDGATVGATTNGTTSITLSGAQTVVAGGFISIASAGPQATIYRGVVASNSSGTTVTVTGAPPTSVTDKTVTYEGWDSGGRPTLPAGYTLWRYIGSIQTDGSSHILAFAQNKQYFLRVAAVGLTTTAITSAALTLSGAPAATPLPPLPILQLVSTPFIAGDGLTVREINFTNSPSMFLAPSVATISSRADPAPKVRSFGGEVLYNTGSASDTISIVSQGWIDPNVAP